MAEQLHVPFGLWTRLGVLHVAHVGATWQIRLNHPCATAMQAYVKLCGPLVKPQSSVKLIKKSSVTSFCLRIVIMLENDLQHFWL